MLFPQLFCLVKGQQVLGSCPRNCWAADRSPVIAMGQPIHTVCTYTKMHTGPIYIHLFTESTSYMQSGTWRKRTYAWRNLYTPHRTVWTAENSSYCEAKRLTIKVLRNPAIRNMQNLIKFLVTCIIHLFIFKDLIIYQFCTENLIWHSRSYCGAAVVTTSKPDELSPVNV